MSVSWRVKVSAPVSAQAALFACRYVKGEAPRIRCAAFLISAAQSARLYNTVLAFSGIDA
jgi:hypothetical protein